MIVFIIIISKHEPLYVLAKIKNNKMTHREKLDWNSYQSIHWDAFLVKPGTSNLQTNNNE